MLYQRTTVSLLALALAGVLLLVPVGLLLVGMRLAGSPAELVRLAPWLPTVLAALALAPLLLFTAFGTLTVTVDGSTVRARFGIGLVRRDTPLGEVVTARPLRLPTTARRPAWRYLPPRAFLTEGSGLVLLGLADGSEVMVGSPEPEILAASLAAATGKLAGRTNAA